MIVYSHPSEILPPPWLVGARNLAAVQSDIGMMFGIGPSYLLGKNLSNPVIELAAGWSCWVNGEVDSFMLRREIRGYPVIPVDDNSGRVWAVPCILSRNGGRAFQVKYGRDWKPALDKVQRELIENAALAAAELPRLLTSDPATRAELMPPCCAWAAHAMAVTNHLTEEVIAALELLDETLVVGTLTAMTSFSVGDD